MARRKTVVIGLLGTTLDLGKQAHRWDRWRPTVSLCQHEDLLVDRLELLSSRRYASLAKRVDPRSHGVSPFSLSDLPPFLLDGTRCAAIRGRQAFGAFLLGQVGENKRHINYDTTLRR